METTTSHDPSSGPHTSDRAPTAVQPIIHCASFLIPQTVIMSHVIDALEGTRTSETSEMDAELETPESAISGMAAELISELTRNTRPAPSCKASTKERRSSGLRKFPSPATRSAKFGQGRHRTVTRSSAMPRAKELDTAEEITELNERLKVGFDVGALAHVAVLDRDRKSRTVWPWYIIKPHGRRMMIWDTLFAIALLLTIFVTTYEIGFLASPTTASDPQFIWNCSLDLTFLLDVSAVATKSHI